MSFSRGIFFKFVSLMVILAFLAQDIAYANPSPGIFQQAITQSFNRGVENPAIHGNVISLSTGSGKIIRTFEGKKSASPVFLIQDAHYHLEAQQNAADAIIQLAEKFNIQTMGVEGASGELWHDWATRYPETTLRNQVFKFWLKKHEIGAVEYAASQLKNSVRIFGLENPELYRRHLQVDHEVRSRRDKMKDHFGSWNRALQGILSQVMPSEYLQHIAVIQTGSELTVWMKPLLALAQKKNADLSGYPQIQAYAALENGMEKVDGAVLMREFRRIQDMDLRVGLLRLALKSSPAEIQELRTKLNHRGLSESFPNLTKWLELISLTSKLDENLIVEFRSLDAALRRSYLKSDEQKWLDDLLHWTDLLEKWQKLEWAPEDAAIYERDHRLFLNAETVSKISALIKSSHVSVGDGWKPLFSVSTWAPWLEFYVRALERDAALAANTEKMLQTAEGKPVLIYAGGFHTPGLERDLRKRSISFVTIRPVIHREQEVSEKIAYEKALDGRGGFFEKILKQSLQVAARSKRLPFEIVPPRLFAELNSGMPQGPQAAFMHGATTLFAGLSAARNALSASFVSMSSVSQVWWESVRTENRVEQKGTGTVAIHTRLGRSTFRWKSGTSESGAWSVLGSFGFQISGSLETQFARSENRSLDAKGKLESLGKLLPAGLDISMKPQTLRFHPAPEVLAARSEARPSSPTKVEGWQKWVLILSFLAVLNPVSVFADGRPDKKSGKPDITQNATAEPEKTKEEKRAFKIDADKVGDVAQAKTVKEALGKMGVPSHVHLRIVQQLVKESKTEVRWLGIHGWKVIDINLEGFEKLKSLVEAEKKGVPAKASTATQPDSGSKKGDQISKGSDSSTAPAEVGVPESKTLKEELKKLGVPYSVRLRVAQELKAGKTQVEWIGFTGKRILDITGEGFEKLRELVKAESNSGAKEEAASPTEQEGSPTSDTSLGGGSEGTTVASADLVKVSSQPTNSVQGAKTSVQTLGTKAIMEELEALKVPRADRSRLAFQLAQGEREVKWLVREKGGKLVWEKINLDDPRFEKLRNLVDAGKKPANPPLEKVGPSSELKTPEPVIEKPKTNSVPETPVVTPTPVEERPRVEEPKPSDAPVIERPVAVRSVETTVESPAEVIEPNVEPVTESGISKWFKERVEGWSEWYSNLTIGAKIKSGFGSAWKGFVKIITLDSPIKWGMAALTLVGLTGWLWRRKVNQWRKSHPRPVRPPVVVSRVATSAAPVEMDTKLSKEEILRKIKTLIPHVTTWGDYSYPKLESLLKEGMELVGHFEDYDDAEHDEEYMEATRTFLGTLENLEEYLKENNPDHGKEIVTAAAPPATISPKIFRNQMKFRKTTILLDLLLLSAGMLLLTGWVSVPFLAPAAAMLTASGGWLAIGGLYVGYRLAWLLSVLDNEWGHQFAALLSGDFKTFFRLGNWIANWTFANFFLSFVPMMGLSSGHVNLSDAPKSHWTWIRIAGWVLGFIPVAAAIVFLVMNPGLVTATPLAKLIAAGFFAIVFLTGQVVAFISDIVRPKKDAACAECGNTSIMGYVKTEADLDAYLDRLLASIVVTEKRGKVAIGFIGFLNDGTHEAIIDEKYFIDPREKAADTYADFRARVKQQAKVMQKPYYIQIGMHLRYPTGGAEDDDLFWEAVARGAHPHTWIGRSVREILSKAGNVYDYVRKEILKVLGHNGDFNNIVFKDRVYTNQQFAWALKRIKKAYNGITGDSPKAAGAQELFADPYGSWMGAVEFAHFEAVAPNLEYYMGGKLPKNAAEEAETPDTALTVEQKEALVAFIKQEMEAAGIKRSIQGLKELSHLSARELQRLTDALIAKKDTAPMAVRELFQEWGPMSTDEFLRIAVHSFFRNDMLHAWILILKRFRGSAGINAYSSLMPHKKVAVSLGQNLTIGFGKKNGLLQIGSHSELNAARVEGYEFIFDLDNLGEVAEIEHDGNTVKFRVYSLTALNEDGSAGRFLTQAEIQARIRPADPLLLPKTGDGAEHELSRIPNYLKVIGEEFKPSAKKAANEKYTPAKHNRFVSNEVTATVLAGSIGREILTQTRSWVEQGANANFFQQGVHAAGVTNFLHSVGIASPSSEQILATQSFFEAAFRREFLNAMTDSPFIEAVRARALALAHTHINRQEDLSAIPANEIRQAVSEVLNQALQGQVNGFDPEAIKHAAHSQLSASNRGEVKSMLDKVSPTSTDIFAEQQQFLPPLRAIPRGDYDLLLFGKEKNEEILLQVQNVLKVLWPKLRVLVLDSNKIVAAANRFTLNADDASVALLDGELDVAGLKERLGLTDPFLTAIGSSGSGQHFDTTVATQISSRILPELFVATTDPYSPMAREVGMERTLIIRSEWTPSELGIASYTSTRATFYELVSHLTRTLPSDLGDAPLFGRKFTNADLDERQKLWNLFVTKSVSNIIGYTEAGKLDDEYSNDPDRSHHTLMSAGRSYGRRITEGTVAFVGTVTYIFLTVAVPQVFGVTVPTVFTILHFLVAAPAAMTSPVLFFAAVTAYVWIVAYAVAFVKNRRSSAASAKASRTYLKAAVFASTITVALAITLFTPGIGDALFYSFLAYPVLPLAYRFVVRWRDGNLRSVLDHGGMKTISFLSAHREVVAILRIFTRKAFSQAYSIQAPEVDGHEADRSLDERGPNRSLWEIAFLPQSTVPVLRDDEDSTLMVLRQMKTILSKVFVWWSHLYGLPLSGVHSLSIGGGADRNTRATHAHLAVDSHTFPASVIPTRKVVQEAFGHEVDAFRQVLSGYIFVKSMASYVATPVWYRPWSYFLKTNINNTRSGAGTHTTASPRSADALIPHLQIMPKRIRPISIPGFGHHVTPVPGYLELPAFEAKVAAHTPFVGPPAPTTPADPRNSAPQPPAAPAVTFSAIERAQLRQLGLEMRKIRGMLATPESQKLHTDFALRQEHERLINLVASNGYTEPVRAQVRAELGELESQIGQVVRSELRKLPEALRESSSTHAAMEVAAETERLRTLLLEAAQLSSSGASGVSTAQSIHTQGSVVLENPTDVDLVRALSQTGKKVFVHFDATVNPTDVAAMRTRLQGVRLAGWVVGGSLESLRQKQGWQAGDILRVRTSQAIEKLPQAKRAQLVADLLGSEPQQVIVYGIGQSELRGVREESVLDTFERLMLSQQMVSMSV